MTTIIKSGDKTSGGRTFRTATFNLADMSRRADNYVDELRQKSARIIVEANQQAADIRQRAESEGRQTAFEAVEKTHSEKVLQQMQTVLPALNKLADEFASTKQVWLAHWEKKVVRLATAIAARIIRRELSQSPDITVDLVTEALELVTTTGKMTIHLNKDDYEVLREQVETLVKQLHNIAPTSIVPSDDVAPGGCRVETDFGTIDQQIQVQLKRVEEELIGE